MSLESLLGLGAGSGLLLGAYNKLGDVGDQARTDVQGIAQQTADRSSFQPFGVTSTLGNVQTDAQGGVNVGLSAQQQQLQDLLGSGAQGFFSSAMAPTANREQDVYEAIRATQRPEEQRNALALQEQLSNQGRLGVRTNMFGGTSEQLALAKAQEEAKNTAALMAMQQAQTQQAQDASLGGQFMQSQYAPQAALLNLLGAGTETAGLADVGRRQSAGLFGEALMGGLEAQLGASLGQANLAGNLGSGLVSGMLTPQYSNSGALLNPIFGDILSSLGIK